MTTLRWICGLGAFAVLGILAGFVANRFGRGGVIAILVAPAILFIIPFTLAQGVRKFVTLGKQLSWWHTLWLLAFLSGLMFRQRDVQAIEAAPVDPWAAYRISLVSITALVLLGRLALRQTAWTRSLFRGLVGALAGYAFVSMASTLWSVYPAWTLYKSAEYLVDVVLLAAILETVRSADAFETLFNWTWTLYGLLLICVWLGAVTWPQEALRRGIGSLGVQLYGVLPVIHANSVGELGAILATVSFSRLMSVTGGRSSRALYSLLFIASVSTLILSQGRSAILGFLFGTLLVLLLTRRLGLMASICITVPLLLALTSIGSLSWGYFLRGQSPEVFQSLSGRVGWWEFGVQRLLERPLTGYGAYAGGRFAVLAQLGETDVAGLHNAYAEVIVGTSVWGLIPLVLALMGSWWVLIRSLRNPAVMPRDRHLAVEAAAVLGVMTARSFFTTGLIWHPAALPFLLVLGYAEFLRRRYGSNRHRRTGYARIGLSNRSNCRWVPGV